MEDGTASDPAEKLINVYDMIIPDDDKSMYLPIEIITASFSKLCISDSTDDLKTDNPLRSTI